MNYGLYLSASGILTNMYRQDVYANNLANMQTAGFKADLAALQQRDPEAIEDNMGFDASNDLLDRLGGGALAAPSRTAFKQGKLVEGSPNDVALLNADQFFSVMNESNGKETICLTRDGRFTINKEGYLTLPSGHKVLDNNDEPIAIDKTKTLEITDLGNVRQDGEIVAKLGVSRVDELTSLRKQGQNLFAFQDDPRQQIESPDLKAGYVESSTVDPIMAMMNMMSAAKAVNSNARMIQYHDTLMNRAVNTLGRVQA